MANASSYVLLCPPEVTANAACVAVVALVGGEDLDSTLVITLDGGSSVVFDGPVKIDPGSTSGSTRFRAIGSGGTTSITATHSGGTTTLADPSPASLTVHAPIALTDTSATIFSASVATPPPGYSPPIQGHIAARSGPVGQTQTVLIRIGDGSNNGANATSGGMGLSSPLVVTLADDAGGVFTNNPATISGSPGYALIGYKPMTAGLRTITVNATGGGSLGHYPGSAGLGLSNDLEFMAT